MIDDPVHMMSTADPNGGNQRPKTKDVAQLISFWKSIEMEGYGRLTTNRGKVLISLLATL